LKCTLKKIKMQSQKTKIYLSKDLCDAIMIEKKTTIRSSENLDYINTYPDGFSLKKIDIHLGAIFNIQMREISDILEQNELAIIFPYRFGEKIEIIEKETNQHRFEIILNSVEIQRFREINNQDAIKDGYSIYTNEIEKLEDKYPGCDAELILLENDWEKQIESPRRKNIWTWLFYFKYTKIRSSASSSDLTEEAINSLLSIKF
jgi:hypothetical protein